MIDSSDVSNRILQEIRKKFPGFEDADHPGFIDEEISYKQTIFNDASKFISKEALRQFLDKKDYQGFYEAVLSIGRHPQNNLLYQSTPKTGDLNVLFADAVKKDPTEFCIEMYDFLYGSDTVSDRIDKFISWNKTLEIKPKWTFATYFLFVVHPQDELFIKPSIVQQFLKWAGEEKRWSTEPSGELYVFIKEQARLIGEALPFQTKRGFLDLQSLLYVAVKSSQSKGASNDADYSWVPFHQAIVKILPDYENRQPELINILKQAEITGFKDFDKDGKTIELREIDPFTFFFYIYKYGVARQLVNLQKIAKILNLDAPEGTSGIPSAYAQKVWLYPYEKDRTHNEIGRLWDFFHKAVSGELNDDLFQDILKIVGAGKIKITEALFNINPEDYLPINAQTEPYLRNILKIDPKFKTWEDYQSILEKIRERDERAFYEISHEAWVWNQGKGESNGKKPEVTLPPQETKPSLQLNSILYGPPGTGKTYRLRNKYFPLFTQSQKKKSQPEFEAEKISSLSWWEVIALVLLKEGRLTVPEISKHRFIAIKADVSNNQKINPAIWAQLQIHTSPEFKNVRASTRSEPYLFKKLEKSVWSVLEEECTNKAPHLVDLKEEIESFKPEGAEKKNFEFITFHQSFSYEDFVEGIKPSTEDSGSAVDGEQGDIRYVIEKGIFYRAVDKACRLAGFLHLQDCLKHPEGVRVEKFKTAPPFAIFIDEINRGNISAIMGELITLIESNKRLTADEELIVQLPYSKSQFSVPPNLHIIGTLNTADRSVEALDTALRRRFSFEEIRPDPDIIKNAGELSENNGVLMVGKGEYSLPEILRAINHRIEKLLDKDHQIGHSYFLSIEKPKDLQKVFKRNIIPLLEEYFYGDKGKIQLVLGKGFVALQNHSAASGKGEGAFTFPDTEYEESDLLAEKPVWRILDQWQRSEEDFKNALDLLLAKKVKKEG